MDFIYRTLLVLAVVQFSRKNVQSKKRIYNGKIAEPHSVPYQVALYIVKNNKTHLCGGSLIKPEFVLTAAHCVDNANSVKIIIGKNSLYGSLKTNSSVGGIKYKTHEQWSSSTRNNDIAIVHLSSPVELTNEVAMVRLPTKSDAFSLVGKYGKVTGWGRTSAKHTPNNTTLMELKVRIVSKKECRRKKIDSTKLCGYGDDKGSTCQGDSGSPLVLYNTDIQIGIVSYGSKSCILGDSHVYTNVASYLDWITKWSS